MKKIIAIALVLMLCIGALSICSYAAPAGLNSLAIVGTGIPGVGEWNPADPAGDMTEVEEGIFVITLDVPANTSMKFKVAGNDAWVDTFNFGSATIVLGKVADLTNGGGSADMPLTIANACTLKITVDVNGLASGGAATILVEDITDSNEPTEPPVAAEPTYFVAGEEALLGVNWDCAAEANKMSKGADGLWTLSIADVAAGTYKLKVTDGSWSNCWGDPNSGDPDGNYILNVETAGDITITFNPADGSISVATAEEELPGTGDMGLTAVAVALVAASAGLVVTLTKKKED